MPKPPPSSKFLLRDACESGKMPDVPTAIFEQSVFERVLEGDDGLGSGGGESSLNSNEPIVAAACSGISHGGDDEAAGAAQSGDEDVRPLKALKPEFYEKADGVIVIRLGPRPINKDAVKVLFARDKFEFTVRTSDKKFLSTHGGSSDKTWFTWTCELFDSVVPERCHFRVQGLTEVTLQKENPKKKWTSISICSIQPPDPPPVGLTDSKKEALSLLPQQPAATTSVQMAETSTRHHSPISSKPTCKVPPFNDVGLITVIGYTGLRNFGNTCFMNAPLQALVNTGGFRDYFLESFYARDISRTNPLGYKGALAEAFAQFVQEMWSGTNRVYEPSLLKELVGLKASQFANFAQHDAQEFLSFLLDGLHEDLNRVGANKPLTPTVESGRRPDPVVADEAWRYHRLRNDSFVVDLFHGQLKSHLSCPTCGNTSITFDPFVYLPVPFPKSQRPLTFYFWSTDVYAKPKKHTMFFVEDESRVGDVFNRLSQLTNVKPSQFRLVEVFCKKVFKRYAAEDRLALIRANDTIFIFQVHDSADVGEDVVELTVLQRQLHPRIPSSSHCAGCGKEANALRACTKCRTAVYCDVTCQKKDWENHRIRCRPPSPELVGQPFLVSLPTSQLTYSRLMQTLEARARHSVDVFQLPVDECKPQLATSENLEPSGDSCDSQYQDDQSAADGCGCRPTKRTRVVIGEPHQQPQGKPLFQLAVTNEDGEHVLFDGHERLIAASGEDGVTNLDKDAHVAMDWINKKGNNVDRLFVETKGEIDCLVESTQGRSVGGSVSDESLHLSQLFERFTETETLSADDAWYCGRCKEHRQANKTMQLWRLPSVFVVQLKRFVYTSSIFRNKIDKHVVYPIRDFDVSPYMCEGAANGAETIYDLYAVVCHSGTSFFGHYTAFARLPNVADPTKTDLEWRSFDDSSVTRVLRENQMVDGDAYFLFYVRRNNDVRLILDKYK